MRGLGFALCVCQRGVLGGTVVMCTCCFCLHGCGLRFGSAAWHGAGVPACTYRRVFGGYAAAEGCMHGSDEGVHGCMAVRQGQFNARPSDFWCGVSPCS